MHTCSFDTCSFDTCSFLLSTAFNFVMSKACRIINHHFEKCSIYLIFTPIPLYHLFPPFIIFFLSLFYSLTFFARMLRVKFNTSACRIRSVASCSAIKSSAWRCSQAHKTPSRCFSCLGWWTCCSGVWALLAGHIGLFTLTHAQTYAQTHSQIRRQAAAFLPWLVDMLQWCVGVACGANRLFARSHTCRHSRTDIRTITQTAMYTRAKDAKVLLFLPCLLQMHFGAWACETFKLGNFPHARTCARTHPSSPA